MTFKAFKDETASYNIDELTLENQHERLSIYGSIQICCDQQGLKHAKELITILNDAVTYLEQQKDLPQKVETLKEDQAEEVENPFWQDK